LLAQTGFSEASGPIPTFASLRQVLANVGIKGPLANIGF
jgi:hypothetical protein